MIMLIKLKTINKTYEEWANDFHVFLLLIKKRFVPFTTPIINICDWPLEFTWLENLNLNFSSMLEFFNRDCDLKAQQNLCIIQFYVLNAFGPNTSRTSGHESKTVLCFCCDCLLNKLWKGFVKFIMAYSRQINMLNGFEFIWWHYWSIEAMHTLFICKQKKQYKIVKLKKKTNITYNCFTELLGVFGIL